MIDQLIDVTDQTPAGNAYAYDAAGRLTAATPVTGTNITYSFTGVPAGCPGGTSANAGKNGNHVSKTVNGVTTASCVNDADRLTQIIGSPAAGAVTTDVIGRVTGLGGKMFGWNARNEHTTTPTRTITSTLKRDGLGRIIDSWCGYTTTSFLGLFKDVVDVGVVAGSKILIKKEGFAKVAASKMGSVFLVNTVFCAANEGWNFQSE